MHPLEERLCAFAAGLPATTKRPSNAAELAVLGAMESSRWFGFSQTPRIMDLVAFTTLRSAVKLVRKEAVREGEMLQSRDASQLSPSFPPHDVQVSPTVLDLLLDGRLWPWLIRPGKPSLSEAGAIRP